MQFSPKIGQILITHQKDKNFTTLYEEAFKKDQRTVQLFAAIEVDERGPDTLKYHKPDFQKLANSLVGALKNSYSEAPALDDNVFENALAQINSTMARIARKGDARWLGRLNIAIASLVGAELSISVTGNARVYLKRKNDLVLLSENLSEQLDIKPVKIFTNLTTGKLAEHDRILISTNQIFNFLSLERIREFLLEDSLNESCHEIIESLKDVKDAGIAAFLLEIPGALDATSPKKLLPSAIFRPSRSSTAAGQSKRDIFIALLKTIGLGLFAVITFLLSALKKISLSVIHFFRIRPKKYLFLALGLVILILLASVGVGMFKNNQQDRRAQTSLIFSEVADYLDEAEAALLMNDQARVLNLIRQAESSLFSIGQIAAQNQEFRALENRLNELEAGVKKQVAVNAFTTLAIFDGLPSDLIYSDNGFLGFNRHSGSISFYDFRTGETRKFLENQNTNNLLFAGFVGGSRGYIFLSRDGKFYSLNPDIGSLVEYPEASATLNLNNFKIISLLPFGTGGNARLYLLDEQQNQIFRLDAGDNLISQPAVWFRETASMAGSKDLAIDGSLYILFPDHLQKYFAGRKQNFSISEILPQAENFERVFTTDEIQRIYITEPINERIVIYDKNGVLLKQITSSKFRDLADIFVDEQNDIIYALSGPELMQFNIPK